MSKIADLTKPADQKMSKIADLKRRIEKISDVKTWSSLLARY